MGEDGDANLSARVEREAKAHGDEDVLAASFKLKDRFSHTTGYASRLRVDETMSKLIENIDGLRVLDYGCGRGDASLTYLRKGAGVVGIDISQEYIVEAQRSAELAGFSASDATFRVMDAHQLDFPDASFDLVIGHGIVHHLEIERAMSEVARVLRPGGNCGFLEPLAGSPLLKAFRLMTPSARTEDERPLTSVDLAKLEADPRWISQTQFCGVIAAPIAAFTSIVIPSKPDNLLGRLADRAETVLQRRQWLRSWNQYVLLQFERV